MIHVLLGTGGGPGSERAAAWTAELARLLDGDLEVVESYERHSAERSPGMAEALDARCAAELERWASWNDLVDVPLRTVPLAADEALAVTAREWGADIVVIGSEEVEGAHVARVRQHRPPPDVPAGRGPAGRDIDRGRHGGRRRRRRGRQRACAALGIGSREQYR
jgi:hypothetical protein